MEGDWTVASGEQALYRMLEACPDIDAVFASNDQMALGVLHAAHRLGKRVPEELLGRRRGQHRRGVAFLAAADDGPSAAGRCRRAGRQGDSIELIGDPGRHGERPSGSPR